MGSLEEDTITYSLFSFFLINVVCSQLRYYQKSVIFLDFSKGIFIELPNIYT